jgi:hypothetical protein
LAKFAAQGRLKPFVSSELILRTAEPIKFRTERGNLAYGYEATILHDICEAVLAAREAGVLQKQQMHIAKQAEILVRSFAKVGIIALVDEATGYQRERASTALAKILEAFISKDLQPWLHTFPDDFYEHLFRLRGLDYPPDTVKRPRYFGHLTNDIVYKRLAPGVLDELKKTTPKAPSGRPKHHLHRRLTPDLGHPKLREHMASIVTIMKLSDGYEDFKQKLDRLHPRFDETLPFDFGDDDDEVRL